LSGRAAWRLEGLGFTHVYRYTAGKVDWFAAGLAREGRLARVPRACDLARRDIPLCSSTEGIGEVRGRMKAAGWDRMVVVVNDAGVVLGLLSGRALESMSDTPVEEAMDPAPVTFRPDTLAHELVHHLERAGVHTALITDADGVLIGVFDRDKARVALQAHE